MKILNIIIVAFIFSFLNMGCTRPVSEKIHSVDGKDQTSFSFSPMTNGVMRWAFAGNQIIQTPHMDKLASRACFLKMPLLQHRSVLPAGQHYLRAVRANA